MLTDSVQMDVCSDRLANPSKRVKRGDDAKRSADGGFEIKTYYPTWEEMKDFSAFMKKVHADGGNRAGLAKIIPPQGYKDVVRKSGYEDESLYEMEISHPIKQEVTGEGGLYQQLNVMNKKKMTVRNFKRLSEEKHATPFFANDEGNLERVFWKNIFTNPSIYGADVPGSLFDPNCEYFNLTKLDTILDNIQDDYGVTIEGVNTTYLYFGMWKSSFCWHTEDVDLYSINYLHTGAPKSWYCIAPEHGKRFERLAASFFPHSFKQCRAFLRHKTTLISPQVLRKFSIPFSKCTQRAGEFMVTFPYSYHSGYNHGFNIAEATNFALEYWIDYGKWATRCECSSESVKISMQTFVKRYQADRYENWIRGKDICNDPRDPKHKGPAPRPNDYDLYLLGAHERTEADLYEEEERNREQMALQQNLSCNLKKSPKKSKIANKLKKDFERYTEYLKAHEGTNQQAIDDLTPLPHFSPVPTNLIDVSGQYTAISPINLKIDLKDKPDYERLLKKRSKKIKTKREDKVNLKKEKKAQDRINLSQELLYYLPTTFTLEKKFNRCIAAHPPHCSVCQLFAPHPTTEDNIWGTKTSNESQVSLAGTQSTVNSQVAGDELHPTSDAVLPPPNIPQAEDFKLPDSSLVLLPRISLGITVKRPQPPKNGTEYSSETSQPEFEFRESDSGYGDFLEVDLDKPSELLQCTVCMLAVHKLCYGLDKTLNNKTEWVCDRCIEPNRSTINCALCPCRGGPLKRINNTWVHITCALMLPNVTHADLITNQDFKLPETLDRNPCMHCSETQTLSKYIQGHTVPCVGLLEQNISCPKSFHATCGHRNGAIFGTYDYNIFGNFTYLIRAICSSCASKTATVPINDYEAQFKKGSELDPINKGSRVIVELKNGVFIDAIVEEHISYMMYDIYYPELSTVELHISERMLIDVDKRGELRVGDRVQVKDTKGKKEGKIKSKRLNDLEYVIRDIRTNKIERASRGDIYLNVDQMSEEQIETYLKGTKTKSEGDAL